MFERIEIDTRLLIEQLEKAGLTHYRIWKESGVGYVTLNRWKEGNVDPSLSTYNALVELLNKEIE